jgi:Na+/melibiose symporter-like transporter
MAEITGRAGDGLSGQEFRPIDYFKITVFGFALTALWGSLHTFIIQVRLLDFVVESEKTLWLGLLTLAGLALAMVVQPIVGAISDRSGFRWGRRRPYILIGTIATLLFLPGIGLAGSLFAIFVFYCLLQVSSNTAQGPYQAFIPDLVPGGRRGLASGVKSLLEIVGGIALVRLIGYFMGRYFIGGESSWLWLVLGALGTVLLGAMIVTVLTVKERPVAISSQLPLLPTLYKSFKIDVKASPDFILFLVSRLLILTAFATLQRYALFFLMDVAGVANPVAITTDLVIAVGIGLVVIVYPAGYLSDRIGRRPVVVFSGLLGALGIVALFFSTFFSNSYMHIMCSGGLLGVSLGIFMSSNWALATDLVAKGEEARYLGLTNMATAGGGALVGLMGVMIYFFNVNIPALGYKIMLLFCFICFLAGSALVMKTRPRSAEVGD